MNLCILASTEFRWYEPWGNPVVICALAALTLVGGVVVMCKSSDPVKGRQYCWAYGYFYVLTVAFAISYHCYIEWNIQKELIDILMKDGRSDLYESVMVEGLRSLAVSDMFSSGLMAIGAVFGLISVLKIRRGDAK